MFARYTESKESNLKESRLIVALDHDSVEDALSFVARLEPTTCCVKVANTLFVRGGPTFVERVAARGFDVFLDLKFHDIPVQVAGAVRSAADMGVWMMNVHASGGLSMLNAACDALTTASSRPLLVGVTVLTSLDANDLRQVGLDGSPEGAVLRLTSLVQEAGLDGVVCSAEELSVIRPENPSPFLLVTPGIRFAGPSVSSDDQKRVMTPRSAVAAGADYLVVGRPVTGASDPRSVIRLINAEIESATLNAS